MRLIKREEDFLFFRIVLVEEHGIVVLGAIALMHEHGGVTAVVENHVGGAAAVPVEQLGGVIPIVLQAFTLDREHRNAGSGNRGGGVILRRIDVARDPAHIGAERGERLDQHCGLDGHVQRAGNARALQRLLGAVFLARLHQAGHFGFGQRDFLAAEIGERNVLDDVVAGGGGFRLGGSGHGDPLTYANGRGLGRAYNRPQPGPQRIYKDFFMCAGAIGFRARHQCARRSASKRAYCGVPE